MTSVDRRRAHLRVGAAATGVFLLLRVLGVGPRAAGPSSGGPAPAPTVQPVQPTVTPGRALPYDRRGRGLEPSHHRFHDGPPSGGTPAAPAGGGGTAT